MIYPLSQQVDCLLAGTLISFRIQTQDPGEVGKVEFLERLPALEFRSPKDGLELRRGDRAPRFEGKRLGITADAHLVFITWPAAISLNVKIKDKALAFQPQQHPSLDGGFAWSFFEDLVLLQPKLERLYWCFAERDALGRAVARSPLHQLIPR